MKIIKSLSIAIFLMALCACNGKNGSSNEEVKNDTFEFPDSLNKWIADEGVDEFGDKTGEKSVVTDVKNAATEKDIEENLITSFFISKDNGIHWIVEKHKDIDIMDFYPTELKIKTEKGEKITLPIKTNGEMVSCEDEETGKKLIKLMIANKTLQLTYIDNDGMYRMTIHNDGLEQSLKEAGISY